MTDLLSIPRHGGEELRVSLSEYRGHRFLSLRQFYDAGGGDMRPGKSGCTVPLWALPALQEALARIVAGHGRPTSATVASLAAHRARIEGQADSAVIDADDTPGGAA